MFSQQAETFVPLDLGSNLSPLIATRLMSVRRVCAFAGVTTLTVLHFFYTVTLAHLAN